MDKLSVFFLTLLGLVMTLAIPALWVAQNIPIFVAILGTVIGGVVLYTLLDKYLPLEREDEGEDVHSDGMFVGRP